MEKTNIRYKQLYNLVSWELRKQFNTIRVPVIACLGLLVIVLSLPYKTCQYLDVHANILVNLVNLIFALTFLAASFYLVFGRLTSPYGNALYQKERAGSIGIPLRMAIRIFVNIVLCVLTLLYFSCASYGMQKFENANHSYLSFHFHEKDTFLTYLIYYILISLIFLTLFLRRYVIDHQKYYFFPFVMTIFASLLFAQLNASIYGAAKDWPVYYIHAVLVFLALLLSGFLFYRCCTYEKEL